MSYFFVPDLPENNILPAKYTEHMISTRVEKGDVIELTDMQGNLWKVKILFADKKNKEISFELLDENYINKQDFYQSFYKSTPKILIQAQIDKAYLEKMAEILAFTSFEEIHFFASDFTQKQGINLERLDKILTRSCEQCHRIWKPKLFLGDKAIIRSVKKDDCLVLEGDLRRIEEFSGSFGDNSSNKNTILIGPEGGWCNRELQEFIGMGFEFKSLGNIVYPAWLCPAFAWQ